MIGGRAFRTPLATVERYRLKGELEEFFRLHRASAADSGMGRSRRVWKSAPSLLTFLDAKYALLRKLDEGKVRIPRRLLTSGEDVSSLVDRNHRISCLVDVAVGKGWGPQPVDSADIHLYKDEFFGASRPRKVLVFSGWRFVPKAVAIIASRAASDRVGGEENPTQPLRFSEKRSFHVFDVCFPSPELAKVGQAAFVDRRRDELPQAQENCGGRGRRAKNPVARRWGGVGPHGGSSTWQVVMRLQSKGNGASQIRAALDEWVADEGPRGRRTRLSSIRIGHASGSRINGLSSGSPRSVCNTWLS